MFWMDADRHDRVTLERSWMDGSERRSLAVLTAQAAHSLSADVSARRLYWISDIKEVREWSGNGTGSKCSSKVVDFVCFLLYLHKSQGCCGRFEPHSLPSVCRDGEDGRNCPSVFPGAVQEKVGLQPGCV